jgi:hypothetical protein
MVAQSALRLLALLDSLALGNLTHTFISCIS